MPNKIDDATTPARTHHMNQAEVDDVMRTIPAMKPRGAFYALAFRNFRLFFYGQLISVAGTWMQTVAQNWLVWQLTHRAIWLGIVSGANALPFVLFAIAGGQAADRYSRRMILIWTQTLAMVLAFLMALLASRWSPIRLEAWHVVAVSALGGVVNAYNMPAQQAFVTDMVEERSALSNAIALNSLRFNLARVLGPMLAGEVLYYFNSATCFLLNGLSFIAVIISLFMMRLPDFVPRETRAPIAEGMHYILETRSVLRIFLLIGVASLLIWPVSNLFPAFADYFHQGKGGYSAMMTANGLGSAIAGFGLASLGARLDRRLLIYGGLSLFCISMLLFSITSVYWAGIALILVGGFATILFAITSQTKIQEEVPDELRGRVLAVYSLVFNGFFSIGGMLLGWLAEPERLKTFGAVAFGASVCLVFTGAIYLWSVADRRAGTERITPLNTD